MRRLNKAGLLLSAGLLAGLCALAAAPGDAPKTAGNARCGPCHQKQYRQWKNNPSRQSCESCHGPGRAHVLAPTASNILRKADPSFAHGPEAPAAAAPAETLRLDLFIMSHCPYGVEALRQLLPLARKWRDRLDLRIHYIAHRRGAPQRPAAAVQEKDLSPEGGAKCESSVGDEEGTDRFVSLHGLPEVLEGIRQTVIAHAFPGLLLDYLSVRCRDLSGDWRTQAREAGLPEEAVRKIAGLSDSPAGDSLFELNIAEAEKRGVTGSPTLFINGLEFDGAITAYPVERHFCQEARGDGPCRDFPACAFDDDCIAEGKSGTCVNPMTRGAKCVFRAAVPFEVTVVNDETCPLCHTGNIIRETRRRFPGARFAFVDIRSEAGQLLIRTYALSAYPSFLFGADAEKSEKFPAIRRTFRRVKDRYVLLDRIVKSYHFLGRPGIPRRIDLFGAPENPPAVEMLRDFESLANDTSLSFRYFIHPGTESAEGLRALCVDSLYPGRTAYRYRLCRGFDVQRRFEERLPEPPDEWRSCAGQAGLDTAAVSSCARGSAGRALMEKSLALGKAIGLDGPDPVILLNNRFRIAGYNPSIRKILLEELRK